VSAKIAVSTNTCFYWSKGETKKWPEPNTIKHFNAQINIVMNKKKPQKPGFLKTASHNQIFGIFKNIF